MILVNGCSLLERRFLPYLNLIASESPETDSNEFHERLVLSETPARRAGASALSWPCTYAVRQPWGLSRRQVINSGQNYSVQRTYMHAIAAAIPSIRQCMYDEDAPVLVMQNSTFPADLSSRLLISAQLGPAILRLTQGGLADCSRATYHEV